ncbi:MAG: Sua5/YciO/YrdC/YwlC family protein, partial [Planctomycetes bacterium]|nr:Sua5/YciO/YrdC/YwlC family protein [Planctomycetota bacterium]
MTRTGRRIEVTDTDPRPEWSAAARAALEAGELVLFPTESGYALAARGDDERALARLRAASGRGPGEPFTWTIGAPA